MGTTEVSRTNISLNEPLQKTGGTRQSRNKTTDDSMDVIQVSNIAVAIKHKQHIINVELVVSCRCLPPPKAFQQSHIYVALFKKGKQLEIGRTEVISNDLNPKFLTTFLLPSGASKTQIIQLRIYNIADRNWSDNSKHRLIGKAQISSQNLIDNDGSDLQVSLCDSSLKQKTAIHVGCSQYQGGGLQYEVLIQANNFTGKLQLYYTVQVLKDNQWLPIAKSNTIQIKKTQKFDLLRVSSHRFHGEESARIRLRCFDSAKQDQELGLTDDIILGALLGGQQKQANRRVQKNGFVMGSLNIVHWKKVNRDSFLTYIISGSRLHLILGIDFSNSNFGPNPLHHPDDDKNLYIKAMQQIVGTLQYFDYYNQIAVYGFGARLPPYYQCVGQCFALNGNYFQPVITGGVSQITKLYKQSLSKIQPHGPTKLSSVIDMAIQFAQSGQGQSTNYYVLILLTDGGYDDETDTIQKIIQASNLPLSIVIVGLGDGNFSGISKLDQDGEMLKSSKSGKVCTRDMIDFINFKEYINQQVNELTELVLAKKTFSEIPNQFVNYMQVKGIRPNKQKKGIKTAKNEFITQKIKEGKNSPIPQMDFLRQQKKKLRKDLLSLGLQHSQLFQKTLCMPLNDPKYFIELYSSQLPPPPKQSKTKIEKVMFKQPKIFQEQLQSNMGVISNRIQGELIKKQVNKTNKFHKRRLVAKQNERTFISKPKLKNPCLECGIREITILYGCCGHLAVCQQCQQVRCILCKQLNDFFIDIRTQIN